MPDSVHGAVLKQLTNSLEAVESQMAAEPIPREILEDFKMAVDHIRLSTWALLTAGVETPGSPGSQEVVARFRMARANELYRHLCADLEAGVIPPDCDELQHFRSAVSDLSELAAQYAGDPA